VTEILQWRDKVTGRVKTLFTNTLQDFSSSWGLHIGARNRPQNALRLQSHNAAKGIAKS
jgi:hypothetical protein